MLGVLFVNRICSSRCACHYTVYLSLLYLSVLPFHPVQGSKSDLLLVGCPVLFFPFFICPSFDSQLTQQLQRSWLLLTDLVLIHDRPRILCAICLVAPRDHRCDTLCHQPRYTEQPRNIYVFQPPFFVNQLRRNVRRRQDRRESNRQCIHFTMPVSPVIHEERVHRKKDASALIFTITSMTVSAVRDRGKGECYYCSKVTETKLQYKLQCLRIKR